MKKRNDRRLLAFALTLLLCALLTACGHKHSYDTEAIEKEATCTQSGSLVRACACGEKETEAIPAKGHTDGEWIVDTEATCTQAGSRHFVCAACQETVKTEDIPAKDHTDGEWIIDTEATCTQTGSRHLVCADCEATIKTEELPAGEHTEGEWITKSKATCTEDGSRYLVCEVCEETIKTEKLAAKGHTDGEWITDTKATCTKDGSKRLVCDACDATLKTEKIPAKGHTDGDWVTDTKATCTKAGSKYLACAACDEAIKIETVPAKGHTEGAWVTKAAATCVDAGSKQLLCEVCDQAIRTETVPATGEHNYSEQVLAGASCSGSGEKKYQCTDCGDSYTETFAGKTYTATEIYESYVNSVGEIITYDRSGKEHSLGTCFVYTEDGKMITNYHVVEGAYGAKIQLGGVTYEVKQILAYDKDIDLAILKISASGLKPVQICEKTHKVGSVVYTLGSSQGMTATFSDGMITYADREIDGVTYTQHDAPISSGNSGGPLINQYGEVIGINTWTVRESQNLNFAINISELNKLSAGTPQTLEEFQQSGANAFSEMKDYIMQKGTYDGSYEGGVYRLVLGTSNSGGTRFTRMAYYWVAGDVISLDLSVNNGENYVYFEMDESLSGSYHWEFFDDSNYEMYGTLNAQTFGADTLLDSSYDNFNNSQLRDSARGFASAAVRLLCANIGSDFAAIGVTAADLRFVNC